MQFRRAFAHEIFTARYELELTQETVANLVGISVRWYQMIESGAHAPSSILMLRLCAVLQIDPRCFYDFIDLNYEEVEKNVPPRINSSSTLF